MLFCVGCAKLDYTIRSDISRNPSFEIVEEQSNFPFPLQNDHFLSKRLLGVWQSNIKYNTYLKTTTITTQGKYITSAETINCIEFKIIFMKNNRFEIQNDPFLFYFIKPQGQNINHGTWFVKNGVLIINLNIVNSSLDDFKEMKLSAVPYINQKGELFFQWDAVSLNQLAQKAYLLNEKLYSNDTNIYKNLLAKFFYGIDGCMYQIQNCTNEVFKPYHIKTESIYLRKCFSLQLQKANK